jgi:hypothetical protein
LLLVIRQLHKGKFRGEPRLLADGLLLQLRKSQIDTVVLVDYLRELKGERLGGAVDALRDSAVAGLADPSLLAGLAAGFWEAGFEKESLDLLQRWLERDRVIRPAAVPAVFLRLHDVLPKDRRLWLLRETIGRWAPVRRRQVESELRNEPMLQAEADEVNSW